jgi:tRNA-dihydrouridine synthase
VHGRTVEQKYQGRADWESLRAITQAYPNQTIIGSGDVFTAEDAVRMKRETGVDIVWIARGAIGNPWIFGHAARLLAMSDGASGRAPVFSPLPPGEGVGGGRPTDRAVSESVALRQQFTLETPTLPSPQRGEGLAIAPPSIPEQRHALEEHFSIAMQIHGEQLAGRRMRKMGIKYARFHPRAADVKHDFIRVSSLTDWRRVIETWYAGDSPGVWPAQDAVDEENDDPAMQTCETA